MARAMKSVIVSLLLVVASAQDAANASNASNASGASNATVALDNATVVPEANATVVATTPAPAAKGPVTPVQKVLQLLTSMQENGIQEKQAEADQYSVYQGYCKNTTQTLQQQIGTADDQIALLSAQVDKATSDMDRLSKDIDDHNADIVSLTAQQTSSQAASEKEHSDYVNTHLDYSQSIDALDRAVATLDAQQASKANSSVFAQVSTVQNLDLISAKEKAILETFLLQDPEDRLVQDIKSGSRPSGTIVSMLQRLQERFGDERTNLETQETNAQQASVAMQSSLSSQLVEATSSRDTKIAQRLSTKEQQSSDQESLRMTTGQRDADVQFSKQLVATCAQKATDFADRQKLRTDELAALQKVIEVLQPVAAASKSLAGGRGGSFVSLRKKALSPVLDEAARFLQYRGTVLQSRVLMALAQRAADDPLLKVKGMISALLTKLKEEDAQETKHSDWCKDEMGSNNKTRTKKQFQLQTLQAESTGLSASIATLTEESLDLLASLAELDSNVAKAAAQRQAEQSANAATIQECKDAQDALAQAVEILKEFYASTGSPVFIQERARGLDDPKAPPIFGDEYKGMSGQTTGVMALLDVVQSDFARLKSKTETSEASASQSYSDFQENARNDKTVKQKEQQYKEQERSDKLNQLSQTNQDVSSTQKELDAATSYYEDLKKSCVDAGVTFENRAAQRQQEIDSLKEALNMMENGGSIPASTMSIVNNAGNGTAGTDANSSAAPVNASAA